ncbi:MAG TPA: hypothetical protein VMS88_07100, partial [Terriglobales bacterium]|nr:hypothetical protein [Terriglobales bacterium]
MISADDRSERREIAQRLVDALAPVLAEVAEPGAVQMAREAAQIVALPGLDHLLEACAPRAGVPWPPELLPALLRVRNLVARALESGSTAPFVEADLELAVIAGEVSALRDDRAPRGGVRPEAETRAEEPRTIATLALADTLEEMTLTDQASREVADRARLLPQVAAALRAALDWMAGETRRPLTLREEDSVLEVQIDRVEPDGVAPAGEVLAAVDGNLGPAPGGPAGSWIVRVPLHVGREVCLMLVQGGIPIAIPWHAVLRLRMAGSAEVAGRHLLGDWPILESPLPAAPAEPGGELPLALVAHGRKRAWLVADRLVWRLPAERMETHERAPAEGLRVMVRTEEGERFWLAEPAWLLQTVEAPPLPHALRAGASRDAGGPAPISAQIEPPPGTPPAPTQPFSGLRLLSRGDVEPIEAEETARPGPITPDRTREAEPRATEPREPVSCERIVLPPPAPAREAQPREIGPAPVPFAREAGSAPARGCPAPVRSSRTAL